MCSLAGILYRIVSMFYFFLFTLKAEPHLLEPSEKLDIYSMF